MAQCVYICRRGHTGRYLTVIDEQGNRKGEVWVRRGGSEKKIGKESRLSPVINGGIPAWRRGEQAGLCRGKTWIH